MSSSPALVDDMCIFVFAIQTELWHSDCGTGKPDGLQIWEHPRFKEPFLQVRNVSIHFTPMHTKSQLTVWPGKRFRILPSSLRGEQASTLPLGGDVVPDT